MYLRIKVIGIILLSSKT